MTTTTYRRFSYLLMTAALSTVLAACGTTTTTQGTGKGAMDSPAVQAGTKQPLSVLERQYNKDNSDAVAATKYAAALREANRLNRAELVLSPHATRGDQTDAGVFTEYANLQAAMGNYETAETYAAKAVKLAPESSDAWHIQGIAMDAQGKHPEAESSFRKALALSPGDEATVLNNLGLNLASQGFIEESLKTLRKGATLAPERIEIERNIRIVTALLDEPPKPGSTQAAKPTPTRKPAGN